MKAITKLLTIFLPLISLYLITLIAMLYAINMQKYTIKSVETDIKIVSANLDSTTQYPK